MANSLNLLFLKKNKLDNLKCINTNTSTKENIIVENIENNEELECFTYFSNFKESCSYALKILSKKDSRDSFDTLFG